jgi:hypothetical protein
MTKVGIVCGGARGYGRHKEVMPSLLGINFLFDQRDPDGGDFQAGLFMQAM